MDSETLNSHTNIPDFSSTVDTSRPFTSVKEAVAIFGERLLVGEIYSPSPKPSLSAETPTPKRDLSWRFPPSPNPLKPKEDNEPRFVFETLKKLEAELEEAKVELKLLKERESETEVALATLNAELHRNMSKLAEAEAVAAGRAAAATTPKTKTVTFEIESIKGGDRKEGGIIKEEEKKRDHLIRGVEDSKSKSLAQILTLGERDGYFGGKIREKNMVKKKKPIIPLVGDLFSRKKVSANANHHNPLYASAFLYN